MKPLRLYAAGPLAAVATSGLFLVMQGLVGNDGEVTLDPVEQRRIIDVVQVDEPIAPEPKDWTVEQLEVVIIEDDWVDFDDSYDGPDRPTVVIGPPRPAKDPKIDFVGLGGHADGDYLPLVRVEPQYPRRAQERGIEGYAVVELTVSPDGSVPAESVVVVEAEPAGIFDANSVKAAQKFKYKPKVVNGVGQTVTGVRYRFTFNLAK